MQSIIHLTPYILVLFIPWAFMMIINYLAIHDSKAFRWAGLIVVASVIGFLNHETIFPNDTTPKGQPGYTPITAGQNFKDWLFVLAFSLLAIVSISIADYIFRIGFFRNIKHEAFSNASYKIKYLMSVLGSNIIQVIVFIILLAIATYFISMNIAAIIFGILIILVIIPIIIKIFHHIIFII